MVKNRFSTNIKYLRNVIGLIKYGKFLPQNEFADLLDISRRTVINWESGELPSTSHKQRLIELISEELGVEVHEDVLINKDIASVIGPMSIQLYPEIISGMSKQQRQLLQHIFLKIENLSEDSMKNILRVIDEEIEQERIKKLKSMR